MRIVDYTRFSIHAALSLMLIAVLGCDRASPTPSSASSATASKSPTIVTTTAMIADVVRNIAANDTLVESLMGPGIDPHQFRPTPADMTRLLKADIIFYNGLNLEGKMADAFVQIARSGKPVYAVTELIDDSFRIEPPDAEGHPDPHVWMDPKGWIQAANVVVNALSEFDAARSAEFRNRGDDYIKQLMELDAYAAKSIATIPASQRILITAHDAFSYFARAYDIEVHGILGISTDSQAGLKQIEELVNLIVTRRVAAVFVETSVSDKLVQSLIEGARARGHAVTIGGSLFSDAMGNPGTYEGTYIGMIDHNVTTITRALGGEAPARGLNNLLAESAQRP